MALATHHLQGSYKTCPLKSSLWSTGNKLRHSVAQIHSVGQKDNFISLKCKCCLRIGAPVVLKPRGKSLKISAFKSNSQNESGGRVGGSKSPKNSVKLSYVPRESEEISMESPRAQNVPITYSAEADKTASYSAIQDIFKSWLTLLRTPSPKRVTDEALGEPYTEVSETEKLVQKKERGQVLKAVWWYFLSLDATIKIPVLTFVPLYLAITLVYGVEVSKELTSLWILGPLTVALYVKMLRGIGALYAFCFKQTVKVVKNVPVYFVLAYDYIFRGKIKEYIRARLLQPLEDTKKLDYKEVAKIKMKELEVFLVEKYIDCREELWPYYCRTIRFLKRTNLI